MSVKKRTLLLLNSVLVFILGFFGCSKTINNSVNKGEEPTEMQRQDPVRVLYGVPPMEFREVNDTNAIDTSAVEQKIQRNPQNSNRVRVLYGPPPVKEKTR